ncbi:type II toxin-antitoxin system RelE/ParE family toxin [Dyella mobilis]|uniref:Type II toxin-antitoxin system RelE/ParE family toxin n=1 Tax=Dyella mobilis TaxID=1849582 RepID=A0ABS2KK52_9GAMM|nr:type II toxin-antitoxin system RelE/ParE family toxin [Dyella mobilis]MBM7130793.1 type II toxin-antitoxin system RelE/ParE family toxin [Dyella mobilis]GLQ97421.1 addiction module antitoxin RelB [Dyella mobilis]
MYAIQQSDEFAAWLKGLRDQTAKAKVIVRIKRLAEGNLGDAKHFDGITELRIDYGPGYRVYTARKGNTVYLLLCGGDKSSQGKDIQKAKKIFAANVNA